MKNINIAKICSTVAFVGTVGLLVASQPAFASGKSTTSETVVNGVVSVKLLAAKNFSFNGTTPKGSATLTSAADNSSQALSVSVSGVNVPDGTHIPVKVIMGTQTIIFGYYNVIGIVYTEYDCDMVVSGKSATLNLDKSKGNFVPAFPATGTGSTEIRVMSPDGTFQLLYGINGIRA